MGALGRTPHRFTPRRSMGRQIRRGHHSRLEFRSREEVIVTPATMGATPTTDTILGREFVLRVKVGQRHYHPGQLRDSVICALYNVAPCSSACRASITGSWI